jgi:Nucleotidyl transferase AbiEii toxin, Type IV TA system
MFGDGSLTFREYAMKEPHPLAIVHRAVLDFLHHRDDAVLFGAQAVNAYVEEARMTQDVDILSTRAPDLAEEIRQHLNNCFKIAARVRKVREGLGYRIYQLQKTGNRHLVDLRPVTTFPPTQRVDDVLVVSPAELIANKVVAFQRRQGEAKAFTDRRDLAVLLLQFPELKTELGPVRERLDANGADADTLKT